MAYVFWSSARPVITTVATGTGGASQTQVDSNTARITALEAGQITQNNAISANATDINNLELSQAAQDTIISQHTAALNNLNVPLLPTLP